MAYSSDLVRRVLRFKLKLTGATETAEVLKVLKKLKDLDITLDVLAETGIGKTVNLLRRHEQAGELAKSLVQDWKNLVSKISTSCTEDREVPESFPVEDSDEQNYPSDGSLTEKDANNNYITYHTNSDCSPNEDQFKTRSRKTWSEKGRKEQQKKENQEKSRGGKHSIAQNDRDSDIFLGSLDGLHQKAKSASRERIKNKSGKSGSKTETNEKSKTSKEGNNSFSHEFRGKFSKTSLVMSSSDSKIKKRKKSGEEDHTDLKYNWESNTKDHSKHANKKAKKKHGGPDCEKPSVSFESCLSYNENGARAGQKRCKTIKTAPKDPVATSTKSPVMETSQHNKTGNISSPKWLKESVLGLMNSPAASLPKWENPSSVKSFERKAEKGSDFCDISEESAGFTGQRLNKKMQVYSGTKTIYLPAMMTLHQQCIRTLQNNIDSLYETGGIPLEILEPVLERCTPEQLLRIEEYNPIYIGETDHLWGKHCERDFKDSKLQEYESWKEMYLRLSQERECKLQRLTKSIVMAHFNKPKGRQVKMAFIHSVAKPPRDVRIQQEIHGTAVQQPVHPKYRVKSQDNQWRQRFSEHSRSSSTSSGAGFTNPDGRKKNRLAPMMAKSLKAFKKHLGHK